MMVVLAAWAALSLFSLAAVGQTPPPPPATPPASATAEPKLLDDRPQEIRAGPTPGAPTISLAQAVSLALEQNFAILAVSDAERGAAYRESAARAQFYPKLTPRLSRSEDESHFGLDASQRLPWSGGSISATSTLRSLPAAFGSPRSSDVRVTLTQPLLRGFGPTATSFDLVNSRRGRKAQERASQLARQRLAVDVTAGFFQVIKQRQLREVARQSRVRSENLRQASEARMQVGLASRLDVLRAELQASQAQDAFVSAEAGHQTALEHFRVLLGQTPEAAVEPEDVLVPEGLVADLEPIEILVERALAHRLDLAETRDQVGDAERGLKIARQNLLPQLDMSFAFEQFGFGSSFSDAFRRVDRRTNLFFTTSYPVERASDRAAKAVAELEVQARRRSLQQREHEITAQVRAEVRNLERIRKSVLLQQKSIELAEQQHQLATLRTQRGLASNFDVVDAENSLVAVRSSLVNLLTDYQVARMQLQVTTGTLDVAREFVP